MSVSRARQHGILSIFPGPLVLVSLLGLLGKSATQPVIAGLTKAAPGSARQINFGHYNKVYGSLAAVIIFLIWMWISNTAVLIGAEFNAELERGHAIASGLPPDSERLTELRDTPKLPGNWPAWRLPRMARGETGAGTRLVRGSRFPNEPGC